MGLFGGSSSKSYSTNISTVEDSRVVADGGSTVLRIIPGEGGGTINTSVVATDHKAIETAGVLVDKSIESNALVSMYATGENARVSLESLASGERTSMRSMIMAENTASLAAATASNIAAQAGQIANRALASNESFLANTLGFLNVGDARNQEGFMKILGLITEFGKTQEKALKDTQALTVQAFETAETTKQATLDNKSIVTIVLIGAGTVALFALRKR